MIDIKEEEKYEQMRNLSRELRIPFPEAFLALEVLDKDGKVIHRHHQRSHSWVRNAYNVLFSQMASKNGSDSTFGPGYINTRMTSGSVRYGARPAGFIYDSSADSISSSSQGYRADAGVDNQGIMVGSGVDAESFEDYSLASQITNGTGAGQLSYVASEPHAINYDPVTRILKNDLVRYFNNNSGGNVSVNEVALHLHTYKGGMWPLGIVSRDKLASTITIPDTGQLRVTYTIQLTYPA
jgi:hypothetical protein